MNISCILIRWSSPPYRQARRDLIPIKTYISYRRADQHHQMLTKHALQMTRYTKTYDAYPKLHTGERVQAKRNIAITVDRSET